MEERMLVLHYDNPAMRSGTGIGVTTTSTSATYQPNTLAGQLVHPSHVRGAVSIKGKVAPTITRPRTNTSSRPTPNQDSFRTPPESQIDLLAKSHRLVIPSSGFGHNALLGFVEQQYNASNAPSSLQGTTEAVPLHPQQPVPPKHNVLRIDNQSSADSYRYDTVEIHPETPEGIGPHGSTSLEEMTENLSLSPHKASNQSIIEE